MNLQVSEAKGVRKYLYVCKSLPYSSVSRAQDGPYGDMEFRILVQWKPHNSNCMGMD